MSSRKLVPWSRGPAPKLAASVWPRSAKVRRVPMSQPGATRGPVSSTGTYSREWSVLGVRRIVAVIGGDDEQVRLAQRREHARQTRVEPLEVGGVAGHVVSMAVQDVEVDDVREQQAFGGIAHRLFDAVHPLRVA